MAYYHRQENDGIDNHDVIYDYPENGETDELSIFGPIIYLATSIFKIPLFNNLIGFIIAIPIVLLLFVVGIILVLVFTFISAMLECWYKILKNYFNDMKMFSKWLYWKFMKKGEVVCTNEQL